MWFRVRIVDAKTNSLNRTADLSVRKPRFARKDCDQNVLHRG